MGEQKETALESFVKTLHMEVEKFSANWQKQQKKDPKNWPKKLTDGDWYEHFLAHVGLAADKASGHIPKDTP